MHPMSQATNDLAREVFRQLNGETDRAVVEQVVARVCGTSFDFMTARVTREVVWSIERSETKRREAIAARRRLPWPLRLVFREA